MGWDLDFSKIFDFNRSEQETPKLGMGVICGGNKPFSAFRARLEAFNGSKWGFLKLSIFDQKVKIPKIAIFAPFDFGEKTMSGALETQTTVLWT